MGCFKITLDCSTENIRYWQAVSQYGTTTLSQIDIYIYISIIITMTSQDMENILNLPV